jgi:hypothetical protein
MSTATMEEAKMVSVHNSNDPEQILENPSHEIMIRLREDSNKPRVGRERRRSRLHHDPAPQSPRVGL